MDTQKKEEVCLTIRCDRPSFFYFLYDTIKDLYKTLSLVRKEKSIVSILGSARDTLPSHYYDVSEEVAAFFVRKNFSVLTGGGGGIMRSSNRGAYRSSGRSLGITIDLPYEKVKNRFLTEDIHSKYFFTRKTALFYASHIFVFFPGGMGTLDELFEVLCMKQTKKIPDIPIILFGREFWEPLNTLISDHLGKTYRTVSSEDTALYSIVDTVYEIEKFLNKTRFFEIHESSDTY